MTETVKTEAISLRPKLTCWCMLTVSGYCRCGPCQRIGPEFVKLADEFKDVDFFKVDGIFILWLLYARLRIHLKSVTRIHQTLPVDENEVCIFLT